MAVELTQTEKELETIRLALLRIERLLKDRAPVEVHGEGRITSDPEPEDGDRDRLPF